jgi:short-subunit dehydrogenase
VANDSWDGAGQKVLVTGASSGIGASVAVTFARAGATVGICARRQDRLSEVLDRCRQWSPDSRMWAVDLARLDQLGDFAARAEAELGGIDVLVNNAGVPKRRLTASLTAADVEGVMAINYFSPVRLTIALLPDMLRRGKGHVINVSSMGAHSAAYRVGTYAASKAALELFTESLYLELGGTGVVAHLFVPGSTRTEFSTPKEGNDAPFPQDPSAFADPDDVATALLGCLADPRFMTFASEREESTAGKKAADPNVWLAALRQRFTPPAT